MSRNLFFTTSLTAFVIVTFVCVGAPVTAKQPPRCPGAINDIPVHTTAPILLKQVANGKAYLGGSGSDYFYIQHLFGTPYEMGFASGQMFKDEIQIGINLFYDWIESQLETALPFLPAWVAALVADFGMPIALEWSWNNTKDFTHPRYVDEMNGIADGAGISRSTIYQVNMIAELIKAQCSIIGANGPATANSTMAGGLAHLRTLDGMGGSTMPIKDYAVVSVYHPSDGTPKSAVFGWLSFAGCVTGFGEFVGVGEKYWGNHSQDVMSLFGQAWTFVTRDVLTSTGFEDAKQTLASANRTCAFHLGIGSAADNQFTGVEVAVHALIWFNDTSINYPEHPALPGLVYWDKYAQPTQSYCFPDLFEDHYGFLDAEYLALVVAPMAHTGSLHAAVFDYVNKLAYFSNARKTNCSDGAIDAYARQFTLLDVGALFNETL